MNVSLRVKSSRIGLFFELLSTGIIVITQTGVSIRDFLCRILVINPVYVDTRIQTIFLNGRAVDDIDEATLADGSVLALSGAMPGLAGAVFRKGGAYASFRSNVSSAHKNMSESSSEGFVLLKLFNQAAADLGPLFFKKGVRVSGDTLSEFFRHSREKLENICAIIEVEGKKYPFQKFLETDIFSDDVCLTIETTDRLSAADGWE
jgi:hypothetical protein